MKLPFMPGQSGDSQVPSDITEAVSNAAGGVPTYVIFILIAMMVSGVVVLVLKARGSNYPED